MIPLSSTPTRLPWPKREDGECAWHRIAGFERAPLDALPREIHADWPLPAFRFLLKYVSRDEVALHGRGTGGVPDVRSSVEAYEEKSPLYGFLQYRRRKVVLKYVPDGISRLMQGERLPLVACRTGMLRMGLDPGLTIKYL